MQFRNYYCIDIHQDMWLQLRKKIVVGGDLAPLSWAQPRARPSRELTCAGETITCHDLGSAETALANLLAHLRHDPADATPSTSVSNRSIRVSHVR